MPRGGTGRGRGGNRGGASRGSGRGRGGPGHRGAKSAGPGHRADKQHNNKRALSKAASKDNEPTVNPLDVFQDDDVSDEEEALMLKYAKDDDVDDAEDPLDLPSDFEDEEIDENEAWDDEDEKKFGEMMPQSAKKQGSKKRGGNKKQEEQQLVDLSEGEPEEEEEEEEDNGAFLSDLLDQVAAQDGDEEEEEEEGRNGQMDVEEGDDKYSKMMLAISGGGAKKTTKRKVDLGPEQYIPESEFGIGLHSDSAGLDMATLLGAIQRGDSSLQMGTGELQERLAALSERAPVAPAAPKFMQDRITRAVLQKQTAKEVTKKWRSTIIAQRNADHLSFPFMNPADKMPIATTTLAMPETAAETPDSMEKEIADILRTSGIDEQKIGDFTTLMTREINPRERKAREIQLRRLKAVMFEYENKMKRRKKIKSKAYHKILRKEKEKRKVGLDELRELDPEAAEREADRLERMRVEERATLRHRNKGAWAQRQLAYQNTESRQALSEQIRRGEELRKKQTTLNNEDAEDYALDEARQLAELEEQEEFKLSDKGLASLQFIRRGHDTKVAKLNQEAEEYDKKWDARFRALTAEAEEETAAEPEDDPATKKQKGKVKPRIENMHLDDTAQLDMVGISGGRKVKSSGPLTVEIPNAGEQQSKVLPVILEVPDFPEPPSAPNTPFFLDTEPTKTKEPKKPKAAAKAKVAAAEKKSTAKPKSALADNPPSKVANPPSTKTKAAETTPVAPAKPQNPQPKAKKAQPKKAPAKQEAPKMIEDKHNPWMQQSEEHVEASRITKNQHKASTDVMARDKLRKHQLNTKKAASNTRLKVDEIIGSGNLDKISQAKFMLGTSSAEQQELISRAFAGDDVIAEFEEEKAELIRKENEVPVTPVLPGWGHWIGEGAPERTPRKRPRLERPQANKPRRDDKMKHVILNAYTDKKALQFQAMEIPFPFKDAAAYESSMRLPVGKEWNTGMVFTEAIKPKIRTRAGDIIAPIAEPTRPEGMKKRKRATKKNPK